MGHGPGGATTCGVYCLSQSSPSLATSVRPRTAGVWSGTPSALRPLEDGLADAARHLDAPLFVVQLPGGAAWTTEGQIAYNESADTDGRPLLGFSPPLRPGQLGDPTFATDHGLRFNYIAGEMANGIGSAEIVEAMSEAGMIGFFGSAGLSIPRVEAAIERIQARLGGRPFGFNLIHSPSEPGLEQAVVDLYLRRSVRLITAAAYLRLTLPLIKYRTAGIRRDAGGRIVAPNHVIAKVSRVEIARRFLSPPPEEMLRQLVESGDLTAAQAELAAAIPVAQDVTAEADSGGHTDNQPAVTLLPTMMALRDEMQTQFGYDLPLRVGLGGGIATPAGAAAAFAMGAAYILTGSVNQSCVEAGTSSAVKEMLARASQADVTMAPAADMFEMGVRVQVLKWGTLFAQRARKLYDVYKAHERWEDVPTAVRAQIEKDFLRMSYAEAWESTRRFFSEHDPQQIERGGRDAHHQMALVFRSYLGQSSKWAIQGDPSRKSDYQVWCGPAMGAFNEWVKGSVLEPPSGRRVALVARNLMAGAAAFTRAATLRNQGVPVPTDAFRFHPQPDSELMTWFDPTEENA